MALKRLNIVVVDAFATGVFKGNQAAVVANTAYEHKNLFKDPKLTDKEMQKIAMEMNLSETAFVVPVGENDISKANEFNLRWFTPTVEVPLCGHATLATAHVLFNEYGNTSKQIKFNSMSGPLYCFTDNDKIGMNFPQYAVEKLSLAPDIVAKLVASLKVDVQEIAYASKAKKLIVHMKNQPGKSAQQIMADQKPNTQKMMEIHPEGDIVRGLILTVQATEDDFNSNGKQLDFCSRYFAPWVGITEDPATGSAHCALGPYWAEVLSKNELQALQVYPGRGAEMGLSLKENQVITIKGQAVTVLDGNFHMPMTI